MFVRNYYDILLLLYLSLQEQICFSLPHIEVFLFDFQQTNVSMQFLPTFMTVISCLCMAGDGQGRCIDRQAPKHIKSEYDNVSNTVTP
jgi:hypothetical protein